MPARAIILLVLAAFLAGLPAMAQAPLSKLERVPLFGREYVKLDAWASVNGYQFRWLHKDEQAQVKTKFSTLTFDVDSRKAIINGIAVWLSYPIAQKFGIAYISPVDLQTAIFPILYPPQNPPKDKVSVICLDPGHGGRDPGNQAGTSQEKKYVLALAEEVRKQLRAAGLTVIMTRGTDTFIDLPDRADYANKRNADLFLSLHFNSAAGTGARGAETYCLTPAHASSTNARGEGTQTGSLTGNRQNEKNMLLAFQMQKSLVNSLGTEDRGVRRARFVVLKTTEMPAILIEGAFMTDRTELGKIVDSAQRKKMAKAIVDGVIAYKKLVER